MKIELTPELVARLRREGFEYEAESYDVPDEQYQFALQSWAHLPGAHLEAAMFCLTHPNHGPLFLPEKIQEKTGEAPNADTATFLKANRAIVSTHESLREMAQKHYPALRADFADVKTATSVQADCAKLLNGQFERFSDMHRVQGQRQRADGEYALLAAEAHTDKICTVIRGFAKIVFWGLLAICSLLIGLTVLSLRAHAQGTSQIDVITLQQAGTTKGVFAAPFKINFASGCTVTRSGSVASITCTGGATSPLTTKGDIWGFSTVDARVPVGADGLCFKADSSNANGVSYSACSGAATGYQTIQNATSAITQRTILNWTAGIFCSDNAGATRSDCALANVSATSHQFFNAVTSGALVAAQPVAADIGSIPGSSGQLLYNNAGAIGAEDPIVSYNYVNLWTAQDVTVTRTSAATRVSTFGAYGSLLTTWAGITGSPAGCTIQIKSGDSAGNFVNNGAAIAVAPANGTTAAIFSPAATLPTQSQMQAVFACATTYPTAGTLTLEFAPSITTSSNTASLGGTAIDTNSGTKSAGTQRVVLATDQPALTNALKVDGSAVTQPISAASLPLPSGASTSAKQPALGTAGSASADVITVQGIASMTALKVDGSGVTQPVSGTVTTTPPANASTNVAQVAGTTTSVNSGTKDAGTLRVTLATDQVQLTNALKVDGSAVTQPVSGTVTANAGTGTFNIQANASVNVNQIAGTGTSTAAAGTQLVGVADGAGNKITTNSTTYTAKFAFDDNLLGTLGTAFTTPGKIDIKGADGDVFVRQATAANLNATVVQAIGTNLHVVCDSGCSSSAGFADNSTFTAGTTAINPVGGLFDDTPPTAITTGKAAGARITANRALHINLRNQAGTEIATLANPLRTDPTGTTTQPVSIADGSDTTLGAKADAKSTATDTTAISAMQVLKEISAMEQAPASRAVTNAGTFVVQATDNLTQFGGTNVSTGTGAGGAGIPRVTVSSDSTVGLVAGTAIVGKVGIDQTTPGTTNGVQVVAALPTGSNTIGAVTQGNAGTNAQAWWTQLGDAINGPAAVKAVPPTGGEYALLVRDPAVQALLNIMTVTALRPVTARLTGSFNRGLTSTADALDVNIKFPPASADPCTGRKTNVAISQTANAQLVIGAAGRIWICSIFIVGADAENVSLVEGTGATCGTGTLAVIGGATAATGPNLAANGGFIEGNGGASITSSATPGNNLCLFQSGSGRVAGNLTFAYAP